MSDFVRVDSLDALQGFRASLCKFADAAQGALDEADAELSKATRWLNDQHPRLRHQVERFREETNRANLALMNKQYTKELLDSAMSVVEERKALSRLKRRLECTENTLQAIRRWQRELERESLAYRGGVQRLSNVIDHDVPLALSLLDNMITAIEAYADSTPQIDASRPHPRDDETDHTKGV